MERAPEEPRVRCVETKADDDQLSPHFEAAGLCCCDRFTAVGVQTPCAGCKAPKVPEVAFFAQPDQEADLFENDETV